MPMLGQFWRIPQNFEYFHDRLGPGVRDDVPYLIVYIFQITTWNLVSWCIVPWSRSLCSTNFCASMELRNFPWQTWTQNMVHLRKCEQITSWPEIWWHGAIYHEMATLSQCSHVLISAGRGCCRSLNIFSSPVKFRCAVIQVWKKRLSQNATQYPLLHHDICKSMWQTDWPNRNYNIFFNLIWITLFYRNGYLVLIKLDNAMSQWCLVDKG